MPDDSKETYEHARRRAAQWSLPQAKLENVYEREGLYAEVWAEPIVDVAARYGISNVMLKKICKKLNVPTPGRGYWAKIEAGQTPEKKPLPKKCTVSRCTGQRTQMPWEKPAEDPLETLEEAERELIFATASELKVSTGVRLRKELAEVRDICRTEKSLQKKKDELHEKKVEIWRRNGYQNRGASDDSTDRHLWDMIARTSVPRVCRFLETLARASETIGGSFDGQRTFDLLGERMTVVISEQTDKIPHGLTESDREEIERYEKEKREGYYAWEPHIRKWDHPYNGKIVIKVGEADFRDGRQGTLEEQAGKCFLGLCRQALSRRRMRTEFDAEVSAGMLDQEKYAAAVRRYNDEVDKLNEALRQAELHAKADSLRNYAGALLASDDPDKVAYGKWAASKADWLDPAILSDDVVFRKRNAGDDMPVHLNAGSYRMPFEAEYFYRWNGESATDSMERFRQVVKDKQER